VNKERETEPDPKQDILSLHGEIRRLAILISGATLMILLAIVWPGFAFPFAFVAAVAFVSVLVSTPLRIGMDDRDLGELKETYLSRSTEELEAILAEGTATYRPEAVEAAREILNDRKAIK
jgi:hypothetical protein